MWASLQEARIPIRWMQRTRPATPARRVPHRSRSPCSAASPIFADTFSTGNFSAWTSNTRLTIDNSQGGVAAPSARLNTTGQSAWAFRDLPSTLQALCMSANVNIVAPGIGLGSRYGSGPQETAQPPRPSSPRRAVVILLDFAGVQKVSTVSMPSGWHNLELCGAAGLGKTWDRYLDG